MKNEIFRQPAFFISGKGTTLQAVLNAVKCRELAGVEPRLVICSKFKVEGILRAQGFGFELGKNLRVLRPETFDSLKAFGQAINDLCDKYGVDCIFQYGWRPTTPDIVLEKFRGKIFNGHGGPLDPVAALGHDFGGKGMFGRRPTAARFLFAKAVNRDYWNVASAHHVVSGLDRGGIVGESFIDFGPDTRIEDLEARTLQAEHKLQIQLMRNVAHGLVQVIEHQPHWLVKPHEKDILEQCKAKAIAAYPHG